LRYRLISAIDFRFARNPDKTGSFMARMHTH
jgi:hypothetical protein